MFYKKYLMLVKAVFLIKKYIFTESQIKFESAKSNA